MNLALQKLPVGLSRTKACQVLGINRSTLYRRTHSDQPKKDVCSRSPQPRALSSNEREHLWSTMNLDEFEDQPPYEIYHTLLSRGIHLASMSTMHRLLREKAAHGERRVQRAAQSHAVPRLQAERPNEVFTWDITKLRTIAPNVYLSLYVVLDLYSRFVVAWMVSMKENSALAVQLLQEAATRYGLEHNSLTVHQDRGTPMTSHRYIDMMSDLGIALSHSRPRVSNDNPMSESQFKTMKYQPDYPGRFDSTAHARQWCEQYFDWYNFSHHHAGLNGYTPEQVYTGQFEEIWAQRQQSLQEYYGRHPERFVNGPPKAARPPTIVTINPAPIDDNPAASVVTQVNFPTLKAVIKRNIS